MLDEKGLAALLTRMESETLDFKTEAYDLERDEARTSLVKDVICMANTPRVEPAFIVLGVRKHADGRTEILGLNKHPDEAELQGLFGPRVYPVPSFTYYPAASGEKTIGVIEIPAIRIGPSLPIRDHGGALRQWQVYFRRGSRNDVATGEEMARIFTWFGAGAPIPSPAFQGGVGWDDFLAGVRRFEPGRRYVLILSPSLSVEPQSISALGKVGWTAVFDFDPNSDTSGALSACREILEARRTVHLVTLRERPLLNPGAATYWYFARGLTGRLDTVETGPWRSWQKVYGGAVSDQLRHLAGALLPDAVTGVVLWYEQSLTRHLQSTLEAFLGAFGDSAEIMIVCNDPSDVHPMASEMGATVFPIPLHQLCSGVDSVFGGEAFASGEGCLLPSSSGAPIVLSPKDRRWIEEELEVVDPGSGVVSPPDRPVGREFLRGAEISWYELGLHYDIDRDIGDRLQRQLEADLSARRSSRINLYHAPGAGGTTIARRMIWNLHRTYPCAILKRTAPADTADRLYCMTSVTGQPLLLAVDGADVSERQLDELYNYLRGRHVPVVVLQVLRRASEQAQKARSFYLKSELFPAEAQRFAHSYSREEPTRKREIEALLQSPDPRHRSAFYFGLQTFGTNFLGLQPYVRERLASLTDSQSKILAYLALAHHYAQKPLPPQAFARMLGIPPSRTVKLRDLLPTTSLDLLVEADRFAWRTAHEVIAEEVLQQVLSSSARDTRLWKQNLSTWAIDFAHLCRGAGTVVSSEMTEVARRTFIYRDNVELLGTERSATKQFSRVLEDIPAPEGALEVLRALVELFPDEPHFWAHLGRFYSSELKDFEKALECIVEIWGQIFGWLNPQSNSCTHRAELSFLS